VAGSPPVVATDPAFATVNAVPEPADWVLVVTGLMLLVAVGWTPRAHANANKP
jgi:hypothetical protein